MAGLSFAAGEWTRRPVLVFLLPVVVVLPTGFFLWDWSPTWLDPHVNDWLMWVDPAGFRWLNETWLKVDRGVSFYNHAAIEPDRGFLISRAVFIALGLGAVAFSRRHLAATLRGAPARRAGRKMVDATPPEATFVVARTPSPLPSLGMTTRRPSLLAAAWQVARIELTELRQPRPLSLHSIAPTADSHYVASSISMSSTRTL